MRGVVEWLVDQYPDLHMDVAAAIADGDLVAVRVVSEGTNTGKVNGFLPPTGRRFCAEQSHWYRVESGKLVEHWAVRDDLRTMQQLGLVPGPTPATKVASSDGSGPRVGVDRVALLEVGGDGLDVVGAADE